MFQTPEETPKRSHAASSRTTPALLDPKAEDPSERALLTAWLRFHRARALEPERAVECLEQAGDPAAALRRYGEPGPADPDAEAASLTALARCGVRALPWASPLYPEPLAALPDPPPLLLIAGDPALLARPAVAIVGARAATAPGLELARETARVAAAAGLVVISGLARGVDGAAHRGALEAGGHTLAVQACGPDRVYPAVHRGLAREIRERGALLTEMPLGTPPRPAYFPLRNRIISGLSRLLVVVEARERSGSLITARHALDQGRDVMAVPGALYSPTSRGTNRLIRDGAMPLLEPEDVLTALGLDPPAKGAECADAGAPPPSPEARAILGQLEQEALGRDELARRLERAPHQLALELVDLELQGRVREDRDGRLHLLGSRKGGR